MDCTNRLAKTKALISFAVTAKLICVFVFAYGKSRFSHDAARLCFYFFLDEPVEPDKSDDEEKEKRKNVQSYISACRHFGLIPISYISKHINDPHFMMKCHPLGPEGTRALCIAMVVGI